MDGLGLGLPQAASRSLLHIAMEEALETLRPARFTRVREFRGLHAELVRLLEEVPDPAACGEDLGAVFAEAETRLAASGLALRGRRLRAAAGKLRAGEGAPPAETIFDGFFTLGPAEVDLIQALAERGSVTVTLPSLDARLVRAGFEVERLESVRRSPERKLFAAATAEREVEEIARRILEQAAQGRPFREMGVVLRSRQPYGPLIETTFRRFGIPVRGYFLDPLGSHPAVAVSGGSGAGDVERIRSCRRERAAAHAGIGRGRDGGRRPLRLRSARGSAGTRIAGIEGCRWPG